MFLRKTAHRALGFARLGDYTRERLGVSPREIQSAAHVVQRLAELPMIAASFDRGALPWTQVRLISTGKAAALVAVERRLSDVPALNDAYRDGRVSWLQTLTLLPVINERHAAAWVVRAREVTLRRLTDEVRWALDEQERRRPFAWMAPPPHDARLDGASAEPSDTLQMRAHWTAERCDGAIALCAPQSVAVIFRAAIEAFRPPGEASWTGLLALLDHVRAEWLAQPRHRDPIFARDGWRCTVPACSSRRNLHDHHVRYRSRGGSNLRSNRTTVCAWHHLHGIHEHRVRVWGKAPGALRWTLGDAFLELKGDRYLSRQT